MVRPLQRAATTPAQRLGAQAPIDVMRAVDEALHFGVFKMQFGTPESRDWHDMAEMAQTLLLAASRWPKLKMPAARIELEDFTRTLITVLPRIGRTWHLTADELIDLRRGAAAGSAILRGCTLADLAYGRAELKKVIEREHAERAKVVVVKGSQVGQLSLACNKRMDELNTARRAAL